LLRIGKRQV